MSGLRAAATVLAVVGLVAVFATATSAAGSDDDGDDRRILMLDNCDRNDPMWNIVGGCTKKGTVSFAEFNAEVVSTLADATVGHPSWRHDPSYLSVKQGTDLRVKNAGGRPHTFTKVTNWGGGVVPPLNVGLRVSPECEQPFVEVPPGGKTKIADLPVGSHRFICCFHPWMRALVEVEEKRGRKHDD